MNQDKVIIEIGIAEDQALLRDGLISLFGDYKDIKVLFEVGNGKELLKALKNHKPSIILLDIAMPVLGGLGAMKEIKENYPKIKIIVITVYTELTSVIEYARLGAYAVLDKNCKRNTLVNAIYKVFRGEQYFDDEMVKSITKHGIILPGVDNRRSLTQKEILILKQLCDKQHPRDIADIMDMGVTQVYYYRNLIFRKTNCADESELILYAKENNIID